jgi:hypothetical protein
MRVKALKARAKAAGVTEAALEEADDADDIKQAVIDLVVAAESSVAAADDAQVHEELRRELAALKLGALRKRARQMGVSEIELDDADDADDTDAIKAAVIALCVEASAAAGGGGDGEAAAAAGRLAALREELAPLRVKALKKRARDAGVSDADLEEADDADNIKEAVVELILASGGSDKPQQPQKPHHQLKRIGKSASADLVRAVIPNGKHAMLSYQWCVP